MRRPSGYWLVASIYACGFGAFSLVLPYMNQYLLATGLTGVQIGNLFSISSLLGLVISLTASSLADRTGQHRAILRVALVIEGLALLGVGLGSAIWLVAAMLVVFRSTSGLDIALRDRLTLHWLREHGSEAYGSLRLWGSASFAALAVVGGYVADHTGMLWLFVASSTMILTNLFLSRVFQSRLSGDTTHRPGLSSMFAGIQEGLSPSLTVILAVTFIAAIGQSMYFGWNFEFIENSLHGGKNAVGLYAALSATIEVPIMIFADRLIKRGNARGIWIIGILLWSAGWLLLSLVQTPAQAMFLAVITGTAQGFVIVAPIVLISKVSPDNHTAVNLALRMIAMSLGVMIGSPLAGWLYDNMGVRVVLRSGAVAAAVSAVVLVVGMQVVQRRIRSASPAG